MKQAQTLVLATCPNRDEQVITWQVEEEIAAHLLEACAA